MSDTPKPEKLTREQQAMREIGVTAISPRLALAMTVLFCAVMVGVPLWEEFAARKDGRVPHHWSVSGLVPTGAEIGAVVTSGSPWQATLEANRRIMREIKAYEDGIKEDSSFVQALVPVMQVPISGWLQGGNEDAYFGRAGWIFYRRDIDHLTGRGFLDPAVLAARARSGDQLARPPQPDPLLAIVHLHRQLAARGIALVVAPAPGKPSIHPEMFSSRYVDAQRPLANPSYGKFLTRLREAGVPCCDLAPVLWEERRRLGRPVYLATDTHWNPEGLEAGALAIAAQVRLATALPPRSAVGWSSVPTTATNVGDSGQQLRLQGRIAPETVTVQSVELAGRPWRSDSAADVLLLGDSFSNIYSLAGMGWGEAGGLAERLSQALGRPVDAMLRNDAGSHATRQMLAAELARGRDRLAGKRVVVWEFATRELSSGDWKLIDLVLGETRPSTGLVLAAGERVTVEATIAAISAAPRPGSVPYKDHLVEARLVDLAGADPRLAGSAATVVLWSMRDNAWTAAARWRVGERVRLHLRPYDEVASQLDAFNRAGLDDGNFDLDPLFAEPAKGQ